MADPIAETSLKVSKITEGEADDRGGGECRWYETLDGPEEMKPHVQVHRVVLTSREHDETKRVRFVLY